MEEFSVQIFLTKGNSFSFSSLSAQLPLETWRYRTLHLHDCSLHSGGMAQVETVLRHVETKNACCLFEKNFLDLQAQLETNQTRQAERQPRRRQRLAQTDSQRQPLLNEFKSDLLTLFHHGACVYIAV